MFEQDAPQGADWNLNNPALYLPRTHGASVFVPVSLDEDDAHNILTADVLERRRSLRAKKEETVSDEPQKEKKPSFRLLGKEIPGIDDMKEFVSRHPRVRTAAQVAALLLIVGGLSLLAASGAGKISVAHAEGSKATAAPVTMLANKEIIASNVNGIVNNPITFTFQSQLNNWQGANLRWGFDFNDYNRAVGTFDKYITGTYQISDQLYQGYYPETAQGNGIRVMAGGIIVKPEINRAFILSETSDNDPFIYHPAGAEMWDLRDTHNLAKRIYIPRTGLPVATLGDSYNSFTDGTDAQGYYVEANLVRSPNPAENRKMRHYFDANYLPIGDWAYVPQYKVYLPAVFLNSQ